MSELAPPARGSPAVRYELPEPVDGLERVLELVAADDTAPTTVTDPARAVDAHVADSLTGLDVEVVRAAGRIADLGARRVPGLALAARCPHAHVALVESVSRKCAFIERAVEAAGLGNAEVVCARAEEWADGLGACDVVTARALAPLAVLAEYAAPLLRSAGRSSRGRARAIGTRRRRARGGAGAGRRVVKPVEPFPGAAQRHLHLYSKVRPTPGRFPPRAGWPANDHSDARLEPE